MTRHFSVTHPDGTISVRSSQNRVYPFAVEVRIDQHEQAAGRRREAAEHRARATLAAGEVVFRTEKSGWSAAWTRHSYIAYTLAGEKVTYVTSHTHDKPAPSDDELREQLAEIRAHWLGTADRLEATADRLLAGPRYEWGVETWNSRRELSVKAAAKVTYGDARVVETVEHERRPKAPKSDAPVRSYDTERYAQ